MKELMDYIQTYDPGFPAKVQGASEEEITRLERLAGGSLPARYTDFLRSMGASMGDLQYPDTDFRIGRILKLYETSKRRPPPRYLLIGVQVVETYDRYLLDRGAGAGGEDCPVIQADIEEPFETADMLHTLYPSLKDMLFLQAFSMKRMSLLAHRRSFLPSLVDSGKGRLRSVPPNLVDSISRVMSHLGFERLPHTSSLNLLYERGDAALYVSRNPQGYGATAELAAQEEREFKRLTEIILDNTALL